MNEGIIRNDQEQMNDKLTIMKDNEQTNKPQGTNDNEGTRLKEREQTKERE